MASDDPNLAGLAPRARPTPPTLDLKAEEVRVSPQGGPDVGARSAPGPVDPAKAESAPEHPPVDDASTEAAPAEGAPAKEAPAKVETRDGGSASDRKDDATAAAPSAAEDLADSSGAAHPEPSRHEPSRPAPAKAASGIGAVFAALVAGALAGGAVAGAVVHFAPLLGLAPEASKTVAPGPTLDDMKALEERVATLEARPSDAVDPKAVAGLADRLDGVEKTVAALQSDLSALQASSPAGATAAPSTTPPPTAEPSTAASSTAEPSSAAASAPAAPATPAEPAPPATLVAGVADLKNAAQAARSALDTAQTEIGALRSAQDGLRGEIGALKGAQEGLRGDIGALKDAQAGLRGEIGALKGTQDGLGTGIVALKSTQEGLETTIKAASEQTASFVPRLDAFGAQLKEAVASTQGLSTSAAAMVVLGALNEAILSGRPFASELAAARTVLGPQSKPLDAYEPVAGKGFGALSSLADRLSEEGMAAFAALAAQQTAPEDASLLTRLMSSAESLVKVRPADAIAPTDPRAPLVAAVAQLRAGSVEAALAGLQKLPQDIQVKLQDVTSRLAARQAAAAATLTLYQQSLATIAGKVP